MSHLFQIIFYQPIFNLLVFIYNIVPGHDIALVIFVLTLLIKLILHPFTKKALESQIRLSEIQPKINELKEKHGNNKEDMSRALMALYKTEKINPLSSCLPLLIQLPFLIAVYRVFMDGLKNQHLDLIYSFIYKPEFLNPVALGFFDFSKPNIILAILAGAAQFLQGKFMPKTPNMNPTTSGEKDTAGEMSQMMNKQMLYIFPVFTAMICISLPSGMAFYWILLSIFSVLQQVYLMKKSAKKHDGDKKVIEGEIVKK